MVGQSLKDAVKMLADGARDVVAAVQPGQSVAQKVMAFENLIPEAMALAGEAGDFKAALSGLEPGDYAEMAGMLIGDLSFASDKANKVVPLILKALDDAGLKMIPDVLAIIAEMKAA